MSVRRASTGALTVPLLLLAACGGSDSPVADPPVSSATSTPTQAPHHESPEHFIRRFAEVERKMENTGEFDEYAALTMSCSSCHSLMDQIRDIYRAGGYVRWAGWHIETIEPYNSSQRFNSFAVHVDSAPTTYRESKAGLVKHLKGGPATEIVALRRVAGEWTVSGRARLPR